MSIPVLPQPNVNDDAVPWARKITGATQDNTRELARVSQDLEMSNRATAGQMGVIGRQLAVIAEQNEFLLNQTGGAALVASDSVNVSPATSGEIFIPFDPEVDTEVTFMTGPSGKFSSTATFKATAYAKSVPASFVRARIRLRVDVIRDGVIRGAGPRLELGVLSEGNTVSFSEITSSLSGELTFSGLPNSEYTLRTSRSYWGEAGVPSTPDTIQFYRWDTLSISYTNLWN